jgi:predicted anti-sigma-YlaC factor YlaD
MPGRSEEVVCQELVELVTPYLEGVLPVDEVTAIEHHLGECSGCRAYVEQMRQTIRLVGHVPHEQVDAQAREQVLSIFRAWRAHGST